MDEVYIYSVAQPITKTDIVELIEERSHKYDLALFERNFLGDTIYMVHERNQVPLLWHFSFGFLGNKKAFEVSTSGILRIFDKKYHWVAGALNADRK